MEPNLGMSQQPGVAFFVRAVAIQNSVQLLVGGTLRHHSPVCKSPPGDLIHELEELLAPLTFGNSRMNPSCAHL